MRVRPLLLAVAGWLLVSYPALGIQGGASGSVVCRNGVCDTVKTDGGNNTTGNTRAANTTQIQQRRSNDCTNETDGGEGEFCLSSPGSTTVCLYICTPTSGACDTAGEWPIVNCSVVPDGERGATFQQNTVEPSAPAAGYLLLWAQGDRLLQKDPSDGATERFILTDEYGVTLAGTNVLSGLNTFSTALVSSGTFSSTGITKFPPPADQVLDTPSAAAEQITVNATYKTITLTGTPGATLLTATPTIGTSSVAAGTLLVIDNIDGTAGDCAVFQDSSVLASSALTLSSGFYRQLCPGDPPAMFWFDGTKWVEDHRGVRVGTTLPSTCVRGDLFLDYDDAPVGEGLYYCRTANAWEASGSRLGATIEASELASPLTFDSGDTIDFTSAQKVTLPAGTSLPGSPSAAQVFVDTDEIPPLRTQVAGAAGTFTPVGLPLNLFGTGANGAFLLDATDSTTCGQPAHCPAICGSCSFASSTCTCTLTPNSYYGTYVQSSLSKATTILNFTSFTVAAGNKVTTSFTPSVSGWGHSLVILARDAVSISGTIDLAGKGAGGGTAGGSFKATAGAGVGGPTWGIGATSGAAGASGNNAGGNAGDNKIEWHLTQGIPILFGGGGNPDPGAGAQTFAINFIPNGLAGFASATAIPFMGGAAGGSGGCDGTAKSGTIGTPPAGGGGLFIAAGGAVSGTSPTFNLGAASASGSGVSGAGGGSMVIVGRTVSFGGSPTYTVAGSNGTASGTTCGTGGNGGSGIAIACALANTTAPCTCLAGGTGICSGY